MIRETWHPSVPSSQSPSDFFFREARKLHHIPFSQPAQPVDWKMDILLNGHPNRVTLPNDLGHDFAGSALSA